MEKRGGFIYHMISWLLVSVRNAKWATTIDKRIIRLIVGLGSQARTHGVEGLEYVEYLKDITDARKIRSRVIECFERACLPSTTDVERKNLLSFVVCGGGPTGVEFAAELFDMLNEDLTLMVCANNHCLYSLVSIDKLEYSTQKSSETKCLSTSFSPAAIFSIHTMKPSLDTPRNASPVIKSTS